MPLLFSPAGAAEGERPNFVIILVDDLGRHDLGIEGSPFYESPHIDRLASSGMRFENGYASCRVCSPSRASLLLGKSPARHGITNWIGAPAGEQYTRNDPLLPAEYVRTLPAADTTLAEALAQAGYVTFYAGKWHLGDEGSWPEDHGFQINKGGWSSGSPKGGYFSPWQNPNLENTAPGESLAIRLAKETAEFIDGHRQQPFLAFLAFYHVHSPIETTQPLWEKYRRKAGSLGLPDGDAYEFDRRLPVRQVQDNPIYAGMIETLDDAVGIVLEKVRETGLDETTVVIFTSDNGGVSSGDAYSTSNLPLRGGKGRQWQGGLKVPLYVRAPGITQPGDQTAEPAIHTDIYPTVLELAGLPLLHEQHQDGRSLAPALQGASLPRRDLYWHYPHYGNQGGEPSSVILSGDWKLIAYHEDGRQELYHLASDRGEQQDVLHDHPEVARELSAKLNDWLSENKVAMPEPNPNFDREAFERNLHDERTKGVERLEAERDRFADPDWQPNATWWDSALAPPD